MWTNNFHYVNTEQAYVVDWNKTPELEGTSSDTWAEYHVANKKDPHQLRSYPSFVFAMWDSHIKYQTIEVHIYVFAVMRYGYYEDACLDWFVEYGIGANSTDIGHDELVEDIMWCFDVKKAKAEKIAAKVEKKTKQMTDFANEQFSKVSTAYKQIATFSNGEVLYEKQ